jgi:ribosomal protein L37AE/L43A
MKTVKQEEQVARSRFVDCPICKNHTLKLKRTVLVGRCKSCSETYKVLIVFVKTRRKSKPPAINAGAKKEAKPEPSQESTLPSWKLPSDTSLFGSTNETYPGLPGAAFGENLSDQNSGSESRRTQ